MAWIELHQSLFRHPKTTEAAIRLKCKPHLLVGHLAELWCWALDARPDGGPMNAEAVKVGAAWTARGPFVEALVEAGFLDECADGYWLHDWRDYAGRLIDQRRSNRERQRKHRESKRDVTVTSQLRHGATVPNPTEPNRTVPNPTSDASASDRAAAEDSPVGVRLWSVHEELSGLSMPSRKVQEQIKDWDAKGVTDDQVDAALAEVRGWRVPPENPWAAFASTLGKRMASGAFVTMHPATARNGDASKFDAITLTDADAALARIEARRGAS